jgi:hypothetical protein
MLRSHLTIALTLCTFACKSPEADDASSGETETSETGDATCPLTPAARQLVTELAAEAVADTSWVTAHAIDPQEAHFALALVGTSLGNIGAAFLISECTAPVQYDSFCEPDEQVPDLWRCSRMSCEAADVRVIDIWFSNESAPAPDAPGAITFPLEGLSGEGHYDPGPVRRWRLAQTGDMFEITTSFEHFARAELDAGEVVELRHTGEITGLANLDAPQAATISLLFPDVALDGQPVSLTAALDEHGEASGTIEHEGAVLASVEPGTDGGATVMWYPPCD